jgi:hypothetical protein
MTKIGWITRPEASADPASRTRHPATGVLLALAGMMLVVIAAIVSGSAISRLAAGGEATSTLTSAFALNTFGLGVTKIGIAIVLVGIVLALWRRVSAVSIALPKLRAAATPEGTPPRTSASTLVTPYGPAKVTTEPPSPLLIHRMAERMWLPVLAMGAMILVVGLFVGIAAAGADPGSEAFRSLNAWGQGTLFLGEGLLLSGIAFVLGTILSGLRRGGGEVQQSLGVPVQTLVMPRTAKAFIALMMIGMMTAIVQFVLYGVAAANAASTSTYAVWLTWLGPLREIALGILLASIVLALAAIARALGFQFHRIRQLATGGA